MTETTQTTPYPPLVLMNRVGSLEGHADQHAWYDTVGTGSKASIVGVLPADWSWAGKRVLDFGCGAGRTLRHFLVEAQEAEITGCDIDAESVEWVQSNLVPPLHGAVTSGAEPPLPFEDDSFDLVYAVSVFTHLSTHWAAWLCEMHRILAPGGLLVATFIGEAVAESIHGEPWDERRIGISISNDGQSWDRGGPMVVHAPWWLRAHWGRLFVIDEVVPYGFAGAPGTRGGHGIVVARKDERAPLQPEDLVAPADEDSTQEAVWLHAEVQRRLAEVRMLRSGLDHVQAQLAALEADGPAEAQVRAEPDLVVEADALRAERDQLRERVRSLETSTSWKVTRPLRAASDVIRARRAAAAAKKNP